MSERKRGLKTLGVTLVATLGLMAFWAVGVQAQINGWLVAGAFIAANQPVSVTKHSEHETILVPALNLEKLCNKIEGENVTLLPGEASEGEGKLKFSECVTLVKGVESKGCVPLNQPITFSAKGRLILHNNRVYILFEPQAGGIFGIIRFNEETCVLPPENKITGSFVMECLQLNASKVLEEKDCATGEVTHIFRQAPQALFNGQEEGKVKLPKDVLLFGANPAFIDGTVTAALSGANIGKTFSGMF